MSQQSKITQFFDKISASESVPAEAKRQTTSIDESAAKSSSARVKEEAPDEGQDAASDELRTRQEAMDRPRPLPPAFYNDAVSDLDIHFAVGKSKSMTDELKLRFCEAAFVPPEKSFVWKVGVIQSNKKRHPSHGWIRENPNELAFSVVEHAFYCIPCVLFIDQHAAGGFVGKGHNQPSGAFARTGFRRFKNFREDWISHCNTSYHKGCVQMRDNFVSMQHKRSNIVQMMTTNK